MTHCQLVLDLLSDGQTHSHLELYNLHVVAHSRVADLRRQGHTIECWREGDLSMYQLAGSSGDLDRGPRLATAGQVSAELGSPDSIGGGHGAQGDPATAVMRGAETPVAEHQLSLEVAA